MLWNQESLASMFCSSLSQFKPLKYRFWEIDVCSALYLLALRLFSIAMALGIMPDRRPALPHLCPVFPCEFLHIIWKDIFGLSYPFRFSTYSLSFQKPWYWLREASGQGHIQGAEGGAEGCFPHWRLWGPRRPKPFLLRLKTGFRALQKTPNFTPSKRPPERASAPDQKL